jgi:hypothetical protein
MTHKYKMNQLIRLTNPRAAKGRPDPTGIFEVTRLMPADQTGQVSYRVKSSAFGERAVCEWEIAGLAAEYL